MLVRYELRKLMSGKVKWLLLLFLAVNAAAYYIYLIPVIPSVQYKKAYEEARGRAEQAGGRQAGLAVIQKELLVLQQKSEAAAEADEEVWLNDEEQLRYQALQAVEEEYRDADNFDAFVEQIDARAERLLEFPIFSKKGTFSYRNILKTQKDFSALKGLSVTPQGSAGLLKMQEFILSDMFVIVGACLLSFQLFGKDGRSGMQKLLHSSLRGRGSLKLAQLFAVSLCTALYAGFIYAGNVFVVAKTLGLPPLGVDIHGIADYRNVSFPCTVGMYLVLFLFWKIAASVAVSLLFQAVIYRFHGGKAAWLVLGGITGISFSLWFYLPENPVAKIFRYLNVVGIFDTAEYLGDYQNLNLLSYPAGLALSGCVLMLAVSIGSGLSVVALEPSSLEVFGYANGRKTHRRRGAGILGSECDKYFRVQKTWVVFLLLTAVMLYRDVGEWKDEGRVTPAEYQYEQFSKDFIGKNGVELKAALDRLEERSLAFVDGGQFAAADRIRLQVQYILESEREGIVYVNERVWNRFFFDKDKELTHFLFFLLAAVFSLGGLFQYESASRMGILIHSTPNSRKVYWCKFLIACVTGAGLQAVIWLPSYLIFFLKNPGALDMGMPAWSLSGFQEFPAGWTVGTLVAAAILQKIAAGIAVAVVFFLFAQVFQSTVQFFSGAVLLFILPDVILMIANMEYINPLIFLLRYHGEPFLKYIYAFSSWASVLHEIPVGSYVLAGVAAGAAVWAGGRKWR